MLSATCSVNILQPFIHHGEPLTMVRLTHSTGMQHPAMHPQIWPPTCSQHGLLGNSFPPTKPKLTMVSPEYINPSLPEQRGRSDRGRSDQGRPKSEILHWLWINKFCVAKILSLFLTTVSCGTITTTTEHVKLLSYMGLPPAPFLKWTSCHL